MYDQGDRKITFSLSFELPIHSHNAGTIAKARADRDRVAAEAEILQDGVAADVEKAYDLLTHSRAQLASMESILAQAQALLDRDLERERAGEIDRPTSLLSRIALLAARNDALTARKSVVDATATLEAALQMPISAPRFNVEAIDSLLKVP
jgi:outer membrane protein TolC